MLTFTDEQMSLVQFITKNTILSILLTGLTLPAALNASGLKKVLLVNFVNMEKNPAAEYLQETLTEATRTALKKRFAFEETPAAEWKETARKNFIYEEDLYTKSAAMNLGLMARQDVVIAAGYRFESAGQNGGTQQITTHILICDTALKVVIAEFNNTGPADSRIFSTVEKIAARITEEAGAVLPSKEDYKRGQATAYQPPLFSSWQFGLRAGAGVYSMHNADRIEAVPPVLGLNVQTALSRWSKDLNLTAFLLYTKEQPTGTNPALKGLNSDTTNVSVGLYPGYRLSLSSTFSMLFRAGAGYTFQQTAVSGGLTAHVNNSFFYSGGGFELLYALNTSLELGLGFDSMVQFESSQVTLFNFSTLGVNYRF